MPFLDREDNEMRKIHFLLVEEVERPSADTTVVQLHLGGRPNLGAARSIQKDLFVATAEFTKKTLYPLIHQ